MSLLLTEGSSSDEDLEPHTPILDSNNPYVKAYIPDDKNYNEDHTIMPSDNSYYN